MSTWSGTLILHNIRSVHNVGSIFRTANAAGITEVILSGYTPTPVDRFNQPRRDFAKVSLGAEKTITWRHVKTIGPTLARLKKDGVHIIAIEQDTRAVSLFDYTLPTKNIAIVLGNEVRGISPGTLNTCDTVLEIPMHGSKESLNVSVAAGIALFTLFHS